VVRRYEEPIEVRAARQAESTAGEAGGPAAPDAFVWRGRLYVVREVLDHWQERRPWWRDALDTPEPGGPGGTAGRGRSGSEPGTPIRARPTPAMPTTAMPTAARPTPARAGAAGPTAVLGDARERQVWRVEASAGRMAGTGVYDLGTDPTQRQWRLLRVAD
jgi:hypothetical protein